jgi:lactate permease
MFLLAVLPILILALLLLVFRWSFYKTAPVIFFITLINSLLIWKIPLKSVTSVLSKAFLLTGDIVLIIFGAIFFASFMKQTGSLDKIIVHLKKISPDKEFQTILFAWLFGSFIEGVSGFGTSGAIVAPFLVGIGIAPQRAIIVSLAANSTAVTFGAVGTPVRVGLSEFLHLDFIKDTALINILPALFIPFMLVYFVGPRKSVLQFFKTKSKIALIGGISFIVPYVFFARYSFDYPSIMGGGLGFLFFIFIMGNKIAKSDSILIFKSFAPYGLLLGILVLGKTLLSQFNITLDLGFKLSHTVQIFNPGFAFLTTVALLVFYRRISLSSLLAVTKSTIAPLKKTAVSIFFISATTYFMMMSDKILESDGILETIAGALIGPKLPFYSAFIGSFGAFLAGSATVSNLLFSNIQVLGAESFNLSKELVLSLQLTGAAAGNMIALPNILAVQAAVREEGREREVLLSLLIPSLVYLLLATIIAIIYFN